MALIPGITNSQIIGVIVGCVMLFIGLGVALLMSQLDILDSTVFLGLLFYSLFGLAVFSGTVSAIKIPGGWEATFREVAQGPVEVAPIPRDATVEDEPLKLVAKSSVSALQRRREAVGDSSVAMTLQLGRTPNPQESGPNSYKLPALRTYLQKLLAQDPDLLVIFLNDQNRFVASARGREMLSVLDADGNEGGDEVAGQLLIDAIGTGAIDRISNYVSISRARLKTGQSNSEALRKMQEEKIPDLVVTDDSDRPTGVVRRDEIMAKLLVNLSSG